MVEKESTESQPAGIQILVLHLACLLWPIDKTLTLSIPVFPYLIICPQITCYFFLEEAELNYPPLHLVTSLGDSLLMNRLWQKLTLYEFFN